MRKPFRCEQYPFEKSVWSSEVYTRTHDMVGIRLDIHDGAGFRAAKRSTYATEHKCVHKYVHTYERTHVCT